MAEVRDTRILVQALASSGVGGGGGGGGVGGGGAACSTSSSTSDRVGNVVRLPDYQLAGAPLDVQVGKKKRGRPPRNPASAAAAVAAVASSAVAASKRSRKEEEDVCFICFDGGSLVMCDHRDCPKAYHPACVKRDESFFRPSIRWNCGWHLCNICQRNALFMCYTCPYSLCKGCVKQADILCVRGNKGFCRTCMTTIKLIEKVPQENKELAAVDFDDSTSWEYLFKVYWIYLKEKEALTLDELLRASNPWKGTGLRNKAKFQQKAHGTYLSNAPVLSNSIAYVEADTSKRRKTRKQQQPLDMELQKIDKVENTRVSSLLGGSDWASKELLEFVAHMKNGDLSAVSQFDVQALLLDYIRKNNLRDPRQKCQIICDKRLENLFGKERVGHFEMLKLLEYHYKEESRTNGVIRGAAMNPLSGLVEEGITVDIQTSSRDTRRQNRRKGDDKGRQINLDGYAAIDVHNINLVYLKRGLLETLTVDADKFHDKVVGSVVRIKISSNDQKQDMHRLVRIIGTSKATQPYKIGDKVENLMLKILNLNKIEDITIDVISDQEFSEDECRRLRQSIKLGLVERMTVGEIQEKAMALQEVRVKDWLEAEIRRLNHLRDRASEMGHRKELRELVEKIELLKTPEEHQRRINDVPEVHADPRMDPSYGSDDDSGESDMKRRDGALTPRYSKPYSKSMELISPLRVGNMPKDDRARTLKPAAANGDRKRKHSAKFHVGRAEGALGSLERSQKTERADATCGNLGGAAIGSTSQVNSNTSKVFPSGPLLVSDISELEKIWHYRDPSGKVQGPFCLLQLRKWDSNGFFPNDLRVWKANEAYNQSILLTNALNKQQSIEPHFQQPSCLQSHDGAKNDDEKVDSIGVMNSNSDAPWVSDQANEECSKSNLTDTASTPEVNEQSVNGYSSQPDSDGQGQSSVQILKAQLIESLFNIEEPSSDATANKSPDMMHVDLKSESFHPSNAMSISDNVDGKCPDAGRPDSGTSLPIESESEEMMTSKFPRSVPIPNHENMKDVHVDNELHDESNGCKEFRVSCGTGSGALNVSDVPTSLPKTHNKSYSGPVDKRCAVYGHEQGSVSGGTNVAMWPSAAQEVENGGTKSHDTENRPSLSLNMPGGDPSTSWATVSCGTDVSVLPSTKPKNGDTKATAVESMYYAASNVPEQGSLTSWSTLSGGIMVSDLPSTSKKPETDGSKITIAENKGTPVSNIPGQDSGISWSNLTGGIGFSAIATAPLKLDVDGSRGVAVENNQCPPPHVHGQDSCISWSTASSLGGEVHLPDAGGEWGWQPIELSTLGDESVSDLLSEVEAMESLRGMSMACADDSIGSPGDDCFSPLGGLSPNLDPGKSDALSSTADIQFQMQANHILPNQRDQPQVSFHVDVCDIPRTSCILSTIGPGVEAEDKPVLSSVPLHNFVSQAPVSFSLPAPASSPSLVQHHNFPSQAPVSLLSLPSLSPPPPVPHHNFVSQAPASCSSPLHPVPHHNLFSQSSVLSMPPPPPSPPRSEPRHNFVPEVPLVLLASSPPQPPTSPPPATAAAKSPSPPAGAALRSLSAAVAAPESLSPEAAATELPSPPSTSRKSPSPSPPSTSLKSPSPPPPPPPPPPSTSIKSPSPPPTAKKSPPPPPSAKNSPLLPSSKKSPSLLPSSKKSPSPPPSSKKSPSPPPSAKKSLSPPSSAKKPPSPSSAKNLPSPSPPFPVPPASKISLLPPQSPSAAAEMQSPPHPPAGAAKPRPPASAAKPRPPAGAAKACLPAAASTPHPPAAAAIPHPPAVAAIAHPPAAAPGLAPRPSTLRLDCSSSPREEGEMETASIPVRREEEGPRDLRSPRTGSIKNSWKQGSEITNGGREPLGQSSGKFSGTGSILGSPNMHWSKSGQVMPTVGANTQWSPSVVNQGTRVSQTSPRYSHNVGRHPGPKDRSHHHHGVDSGFGKSRPTWNRQSSFGARGGSSRPLHQGQRVCKFYESGYCKKGASCKYLHP